MIISFFRFFYFSETNQSFPSHVENVVICGSTDEEILGGVNQIIRSTPDAFRHERVGPLSTDTRLLNKNSNDINWTDLSNLVQIAHQKTDNGAVCLFLDTRLIVGFDDPIAKIATYGESCDLSNPYVDMLLETVYLVAEYDHFKSVPIAPVYLMKESSFQNTISRFLIGVKISEFKEVCIFKCDRILNLSKR
jgi:hypothetical protein